MARCGGGTGCQCITQGGQGINVSGSGSATSPSVISVDISGDAGNCARFGSDGGVYAPCGGEGGDDVCGVSVDNLPEQRVVFGRGGAGRLLAPDHTMLSFQRAVDLGVDGSHVHVRELGDGTPVAFPGASTTNWSGIPDLDLSDLTAGGYANIPIRIGWNDQLPAPQASLGGRHGFFGFGELDTHGAMTLAQVLELVGRRAVLLLQMIPPYSDGFPQRVLSMVYRYCAQESVIVATRLLDDLDLFINGGLQGCLFIDLESQADEAPPALVASRGVEWVAARVQSGPSHAGPTEDQILGYSLAGINVLGFMCNRHHEWELLDTLGARGCISDDALYMTADPERYRSRNMSESLIHPQVQPGMLGYWTDNRFELASGPGAPGEVTWPNQGRGFYYPTENSAADAFYMPGRLNRPTVDEPDGELYRTPSGTFDVNIGFLAPIPWESWVLECDLSFRDTPTTNRSVGFIVNLPDDRAFDDRVADDGNYWVCGLSWSGQVFVERWANNVLVTDTRTPGPQLSEDVFYRVRVTVTPTTVTMAKLNASGTVQVEASAEDPNLRGPYLQWYKKETTPTNVWDPFALACRRIQIVEGP